MDEARAMAKQILENIPAAISNIKKLINESMRIELEEGLKREASYHVGGKITPTPDGLERMKGFLKK